VRDNRDLTAKLILAALLACALPGAGRQFDVVVYGASAGGVAAALAAKREGATVALIAPGRFVGGLTSGGWGVVGEADRALAAGLAREFYERVGRRYGKPVAWAFEPHAALAVFRAMLREAGVAVFREQPLREEGGVKKRKRRIRRVITEEGEVFAGRVFIDATYEGDLIAQAQASYARAEAPEAEVADLTFALCFSEDAALQLPYPKPSGYDPAAFQAASGGPDTLAGWLLLDPLPGAKLAARFRAGVPGLPAASGWVYAEADYRRRAEFYQMRIDHVAGLLYFLAHDEAAPKPVRERLAAYGLCGDEFAYTNGWPYQIYLAESRRLAGMETLEDLEDPQKPLPIPFGVLVPRRDEVRNLLAVLSPSCTGRAWSLLRREPVSMMLGEIAGVAAAMAVRDGVAVQELDRETLAAGLRALTGRDVVY